MTNHNTSGQPVTFTTQDLVAIFAVLGALRPIIAREQGAWPQGTRDAISKVYSLVTFQVDGGCRIDDGTPFVIATQPQSTPPEKQNGDK